MTVVRLAVIALVLAILAATANRLLTIAISDAVYEIEIREYAERQDEQDRINACIQGKGWAVFSMPEPPTPETQSWPAQYLGCNVRFQ